MRIFETASGFGPASEYNSCARPSGRPDIDTQSFRKRWKNRNFWIMCGITGYLGGKDAYPVLVDGLKQLEYRGYDSAGVALVSDSGKLNVYKEKGKVSDLEDYIGDKDRSGHVGIAHTRWATHGEPCARNAHPHVSASGRFAIVHNGIIENYSVIKENLERKGYVFSSSTDTEALVQLIDYMSSRQESSDTVSILQAALREVVGAYAIALIDMEHPDCLYAARKSSPLVIGIGDGEFYLASDVNPVASYTEHVIFLEDEEIAQMCCGESLRIVNLANDECRHEVTTVPKSLGKVQKGGFGHYMLKEIYEQPDCIRDCMRGRVNIEDKTVFMSAVHEHRDRLLSAGRFIIVACGTSWHAGLIGKQLFENLCQIPTEVAYASEFRYSNPVVGSRDVVFAISQSGETADTLAAVELARSKGAFVYGICNAVGSSIPRSTDTGSYIHVGPEIGVASTKAFTGQVTVLTMIALDLAREKHAIDDSAYHEIVGELARIPDKMKSALRSDERIAALSGIFTYARNFIYLGRGYSYPVALEGALKLKEISYIHAEGYPAAEMKHGPIALIDEEMPVVIIATRNALYGKVLSNVQEIKARKGRVIAVVSEGDDVISRIADTVIEVPTSLECLDPLLSTIPLQLLAYHIAVCKGKDVDRPRNLAKSVTVE